MTSDEKLLDALQQYFISGGSDDAVNNFIDPLGIEEAHRLRDLLVDRIVAGGARKIGYKVAGSSRVIQQTDHPEGPMVGVLLSSALWPEDQPISIGSYKRVIVEGEVAVLLKKDIPGPITPGEMIVDAVEGVFPAIEVVPFRLEGRPSHAMRIVGSKLSGQIIVGGPMQSLKGRDLRSEGMVIRVNGQVVGSATGVEVMGNPLNSVAFVANSLHSRGQVLKAGMLIMTGSFIGNQPVQAGDDISVEFTSLGRVSSRFCM